MKIFYRRILIQQINRRNKNIGIEYFQNPMFH